MKQLFLFLTSVFSCSVSVAQTKELPGCKTINNELTSINNSFDNIVEKFKSKEDKISLVKTYFSEFSICGEKGKIKDYGRNVEFKFQFTDADYRATKEEFALFFEKIVKELNMVFGATHYYNLSNEEAGRSCYFYETGKDISSSKKMIRLLLSYKDAVDESEVYSLSLAFEYYPRR